jgi:DNA-binding SARP family transcriptional activator
VPDSDEDNARGYLRNALRRLRRAIEAGLPAGVQYIRADELTLAFNPMAPA